MQQQAEEFNSSVKLNKYEGNEKSIRNEHYYQKQTLGHKTEQRLKIEHLSKVNDHKQALERINCEMKLNCLNFTLKNKH